MKKKQMLFNIIAIFPFFHVALAQRLEGRVLDLKTMKIIPDALVILKKENGDVLHRISTDENGIFKFQRQYDKSDYELEVSSAGHLKKSIPVNISKDTILTISLASNINELEEIVVIAEKTKTEQLLDKKVISVGRDLLSGGGNALTVLERLPEIQSDINGNISLRGDKNVNVLVNGKPSPLSVAELLRQIPASNINKIEIITSPSAKYQASGLTGIVNIITHQKVALGVSINTAAAANSIGGYNGDVDVNIGREKVNYSFGVGYVREKYKNKSLQSRDNINPFSTENNFLFKGDIYRAKARLDWFINKSNEFSLGVNYADNSHKMMNDGMILQNNERISQNNLSSHNHKTFDFTTNYRHVFNKPENYLELDLYMSNNGNHLKSEFQNNIGLPDNRTDNTVAISRASADYAAKINKTISIEAGMLWEKQQLDNNFLSFDKISLVQTNNQFQNIQSTYASYGLLKFNMKKVNIQVGLRGEMFRREASLITEGNTIKSDYDNLFPSLHVGYNMTKGNSISFGFNRRTTRPSLDQVNPNSNQNDRFSIYVGAPDLRPEFSNNFDFNFQIKKPKFSLITGVSYRLKEGIILDNIFVNSNGVNVFKPFNGGNSSAFGVDVSSTVKPLTGWDSKLYVNWNYEYSNQRDIYFFRDFRINYGITLQNDIKLSAKTELGITWQYNGAEKSYLSDNKENQNVDIAFRRSILKNNGSITLRFSDVFNTKIYEGDSYGVNFVNKYRYKPLSRAVYLSFTYNFLKGKKVNERNIKSRDYKSGVMD